MEQAVRLDKDKRRDRIAEILQRDPGKTDQCLAEFFGVSVATIRLDRRMRGIPQLRERLEAAVQTAASEDCPELEILELVHGESALAVLRTTAEMAGASGIVPAEKLYGVAAALANALVGHPFAPTQVGNIKYKTPAGSGRMLLVKAHITRMRGSRQYIYVEMSENSEEVFRAKFIMNVIEDADPQTAAVSL